jgi:hypothetical protein
VSREPREIDAPRNPGISTGVVALVLAVIPAAWIGLYLLLLQFAGTASITEGMLAAEPIALPIVGALALVIALFALWRDTSAGRILAVIAIAAVLLQTAALAALILL